MKLQGWQSLLVVTIVFTAFLIGIFWGRTSTGQHLPLSETPQNNNTKAEGSVNLEDTRSIIDGRININRASIDELTLLPGIGETTARHIIDYRNANGLFAKIDDLKNVEGIGDSRLLKIKNYITVGG